MPIYEYKCDSCNHIFEKLVFKDEDNVLCEKCKKETHKVMSTANFEIKGFNAENGYSKKGE